MVVAEVQIAVILMNKLENSVLTRMLGLVEALTALEHSTTKSIFGREENGPTGFDLRPDQHT